MHLARVVLVLVAASWDEAVQQGLATDAGLTPLARSVVVLAPAPRRWIVEQIDPQPAAVA